ncbi:Response regulator containing a CheY-like receiver domain and an HTH DNA-binding domain [uncultured Pleomorphomonas sp.]|uniref:Response regulator containing a CheY-like receiver domain and an HTH DNA-binding domain n=1 Tax=uncultured Pleomorphomonas sp. TaxID=442121 RepID=A0A212LF68_9HYPH|nr:LuxR family transcriptional regulator [uncultured Pleomorphomonas sp.]SCM76213.1 Response regulator containing a CheY-like receiver domain and an HTH DNA-binding domain [uncultured Pleomorphomonas sp.]
MDIGEIRKRRLLRLVEARGEPVVLIEALAGMGKSRLLADLAAARGLPVRRDGQPPGIAGDLRLWDVPADAPAARLPDLAAGGRLVLARRPATRLPGLERLAAFGAVYKLTEEALLYEARELVAAFGERQGLEIALATGGWPLLIDTGGRRSIDPVVFSRFIAEEILADLPAETLVRLAMMLAGRRVTGGAAPLPLARLDASGAWEIGGRDIAGPLAGALVAEQGRRIADPGLRPAMAAASAELGFTTETILNMQRSGEFEAAERLLETEHGWYFLYFHGAIAFDAVLAGFPEEASLQSDTVALCRALQALKHGEVSLARRLLADRFGSATLDPGRVLVDRGRYTVAFRSFRLVMLIYEDIPLTDELLRLAFAILADLPIEAHLLRGSIHNAILEFYLRSRRFAEADDVAERALRHYRAAGASLLAFYISLHLAIMRLMAGDAASAGEWAAEAERDIASLGFDSPHDQLLLKLLKGCVGYEEGSDEALILFLNRDLELFSHGEIWPTLIEFALQYGSQALSRRYSTIAARSFLDRWRVYQVQNRQFQMMIDSREVTVMQNGNRWREAADRLAQLPTPVTQAVASNARQLARLGHRDEIAVALCWLRHMVFETPTRPDLVDCLAAIEANLALTARQRIGVQIWNAYVLKRQRDLTRARAQLQATFETVARNGCIGSLSEEQVFLADLLANRRIADFLSALSEARQVLRRLRDFGLGNSGLGSRNGLSRQETKVLMMVTEGASNKFVAKMLQISEATVKFHLGNVYRKLGCRRRKEAIAAARALGLVG